MGRHASAKNSFAISTWLISVIAIVVLVLVVGSAWLLNSRGSEEADPAAASESSESANPSSSPSTESSSRSPASSAVAPESQAPTPTPTATPQPPAVQAADTLLLLDTSAGMSASFDPVSAAMATTASSLSGAGKSVALWNYSSPLSANATVGYRDNLGFGDGNAVAGTLSQFGTGGVPQTRTAVIAAVNSAAQRSAETGQDTRVLVVTTGTQQDIDDETFRQGLNAAKGDKVKLSVLTVGSGEKDAVLSESAEASSEVENPSDSAAVSRAFSEAAGA